MAFIHNLKTLEERKWGEGKETLFGNGHLQNFTALVILVPKETTQIRLLVNV